MYPANMGNGSRVFYIFGKFVILLAALQCATCSEESNVDPSSIHSRKLRWVLGSPIPILPTSPVPHTAAATGPITPILPTSPVPHTTAVTGSSSYDPLDIFSLLTVPILPTLFVPNTTAETGLSNYDIDWSWLYNLNFTYTASNANYTDYYFESAAGEWPSYNFTFGSGDYSVFESAVNETSSRPPETTTETINRTWPGCPGNAWTRFFNRDQPSGNCDCEDLEFLRFEYPGAICEHPTEIDVRTVNDNLPHHLIPNMPEHTIGPNLGFRCTNGPLKRCRDFKVRFCCPTENGTTAPTTNFSQSTTANLTTNALPTTKQEPSTTSSLNTSPTTTRTTSTQTSVSESTSQEDGAVLLENSDGDFQQIFCYQSDPNASPCNTLASCDRCQDRVRTFAFFVVLIAVAILVSSIWKILSHLRGTTPDTKTHDRVWISHAASNLLTGVLLLVVTMYNFGRTIHTPWNQFEESLRRTNHSGGAKAGGIFLILCYAAPLYHWVLVAALRCFAALTPRKIKAPRLGTVYVSLVVVWIAAIFVAILPAWVGSSFGFVYFPPTFLFTLSNGINSETWNATPIVVYGVFVFLVPYLATVGLLVATLVITKNRASAAKEQRSTITSIIQAIVFTIVMFPLVVVLLIEFSEGHGKTTAVAHLVTFYISTIHSICSYIVDAVRQKSDGKSKFEKQLQAMDEL